MGVYVYFRKTTDWSQMTYDSLDGSVVNTDKLRQAILIWDQYMRVPYFEYRRQLKDIALERLRYQVVQDPLSIGDDDWLAPTDDDDWFGPLDEIRDVEADIVHWQSLIVNSISSFYEVIGSPDHHPESNAYAIRGRYLKLVNEEVRGKILCCHQKALKYSVSKVFLSKVLSAYNKHPGSAHVLKSAKTKDEVLRLFSSSPLPPSPWPDYQPSICAMARLVTTVPPCLGGR